MGSLSFAEIMTIALVILIIFGPDRLPEFARKIGKLVAQARQATSQLAQEISGEWRDAADPVRQAREDYEGIKDDLRQAGAVFTGLGDTNLSGSDPNRVGYEPAPRVEESPAEEPSVDEPATDDENDGETLP